MQPHQHVHMVGNATDSQGHAFQLAALLGYGRIQPRLDLISDQGEPILGGPHQVQVKLGVRCSHG